VSHGAAAREQLCRERRQRKHDDAAPRDDRVRRPEELAGELRAEGEEECADRPRREHRECGEQERAPDDRRHARALDREAQSPSPGHGLGHEERTGEGGRLEHEQCDVRQETRLPADLHE
jgi:hypothetical protein